MYSAAEQLWLKKKKKAVKNTKSLFLSSNISQDTCNREGQEF